MTMQTATIRDHTSTVGVSHLNIRLERLPLLAPPEAGGSLQSLFGSTSFLPKSSAQFQLRSFAGVTQGANC